MNRLIAAIGCVWDQKNAVVLAFVLFPGLGSFSHAYMTIQLGQGVPESVETDLLASTTAQFTTNIVVNPFFPNTYELTILGTNPFYNPAVTNADLLQNIVTVDSYTYVYGWAAGVSYQQVNQEDIIGGFGNLCGFATNYNLIQASTSTWNVATCQDTVTNIIDYLFQESLSTAPVLGF